MTDEPERLDGETGNAGDGDVGTKRLDDTGRLEEGDDGTFRRRWTFEAEPERTADLRVVSQDGTRVDAALESARGGKELFESASAAVQVSERVDLPAGEEEYELTVVDAEGVDDPPRVSVAVIEEAE